jgi:hypothetical protein
MTGVDWSVIPLEVKQFVSLIGSYEKTDFPTPRGILSIYKEALNGLNGLRIQFPKAAKQFDALKDSGILPPLKVKLKGRSPEPTEQPTKDAAKDRKKPYFG